MAEIKTYGFRISTDECMRRRNELIYDVNKVEGFLAFAPDPNGFGQVLLFDTIKNRNAAMRYFKGLYNTVTKIPVEIYVDDKYLTKEGKATTEEILGDDEFGKMIQELLSNEKKQGIEEGRKMAEAELVEKNNLIGELKGKVVELERDNSGMLARINALTDAKESLVAGYEKKVKELNKEILRLEADLKRMERVNLYGEDDGR